MKKVIGLVGEKGSGKQTFVNFLKDIATDLKISQVRFSDILAQTLLIWDLPVTRSNLQKLSIAMNDTFGEKTLAHAAEFNIATDTADVIILDGARQKEQIEMIKAQIGSVLIYITAERDLRYKRLKKRSEKVGETGLSFEQFMKEEEVKTETEIPKLGKKAEIKIENNGTLQDFKEKIQAFYNTNLK
ncbi:MAG: hypothetical protein Q7R49_02265 [Candidatus Daviesbacteria bacterium]|nr:hypothetical protein [Candidatus Daviesbacteria bacterium]